MSSPRIKHFKAKDLSYLSKNPFLKEFFVDPQPQDRRARYNLGTLIKDLERGADIQVGGKPIDLNFIKSLRILLDMCSADKDDSRFVAAFYKLPGLSDNIKKFLCRYDQKFTGLPTFFLLDYGPLSLNGFLVKAYPYCCTNFREVQAGHVQLEISAVSKFFCGITNTNPQLSKATPTLFCMPGSIKLTLTLESKGDRDFFRLKGAEITDGHPDFIQLFQAGPSSKPKEFGVFEVKDLEKDRDFQSLAMLYKKRGESFQQAMEVPVSQETRELVQGILEKVEEEQVEAKLRVILADNEHEAEELEAEVKRAVASLEDLDPLVEQDNLVLGDGDSLHRQEEEEEREGKEEKKEQKGERLIEGESSDIPLQRIQASELPYLETDRSFRTIFGAEEFSIRAAVGTLIEDLKRGTEVQINGEPLSVEFIAALEKLRAAHQKDPDDSGFLAALDKLSPDKYSFDLKKFLCQHHQAFAGLPTYFFLDEEKIIQNFGFPLDRPPFSTLNFVQKNPDDPVRLDISSKDGFFFSLGDTGPKRDHEPQYYFIPGPLTLTLTLENGRRLKFQYADIGENNPKVIELFKQGPVGGKGNGIFSIATLEEFQVKDIANYSIYKKLKSANTRRGDRLKADLLKHRQLEEKKGVGVLQPEEEGEATRDRKIRLTVGIVLTFLLLALGALTIFFPPLAVFLGMTVLVSKFLAGSAVLVAAKTALLTASCFVTAFLTAYIDKPLRWLLSSAKSAVLGADGSKAVAAPPPLVPSTEPRKRPKDQKEEPGSPVVENWKRPSRDPGEGVDPAALGRPGGSSSGAPPDL